MFCSGAPCPPVSAIDGVCQIFVLLVSTTHVPAAVAGTEPRSASRRGSRQRGVPEEALDVGPFLQIDHFAGPVTYGPLANDVGDAGAHLGADVIGVARVRPWIPTLILVFVMKQRVLIRPFDTALVVRADTISRASLRRTAIDSRPW